MNKKSNIQKTVMLSFISILSIIIFFTACNKDDYSLESYTKVNAQLALKKIQTFFSDIKPKNSDITLVSFEKGKIVFNDLSENSWVNHKTPENINGIIYTHIIEENETNLNYLFSDFSNVELLSIAKYSIDENEINGVVAYIYDNSGNKMIVNVYSVIDTNLHLIEGFPKIVNDVLFEDLMYIGNTYFESNNITAVTIGDYTRELDFNYNDLYLAHMLDFYRNNDWIMGNSYGFYDFDASERCSMAVHHCKSGRGPRCTAYGCRESCIRYELTDALSLRNLSHLNNTFEENLANALLYEFKDLLNGSIIGEQCVDLYYILGQHFLHSLNTEMVYDLALLAPSVKISIESFSTTSMDEIVLSQSLYDNISSLMQKSKNNSISSDYKKAVDMFLNKLENLVNLKRTELQNVL